MPFSRSDPLPDGWEMLFDKHSGWPVFVDNNTRNTTWSDPRLSHFRNPFATHDFPTPARTVEIPVRYEREPGFHSERERFNHQPSASDRADFFQTGQPTSQAHRVSRHPQPPSAPRKRGNVWEIPIQYVGHDSTDSPQQYPSQSPARDSQSPVPESQPKSKPQGSVSIPVVHQASEPAPSRESPRSPRAAPKQRTNNHDSPRASPTPDAPTPQESCQSESAAESLEHEDQEPAQPDPSARSLEEKAFEIINGIMIEVKALEEQVNTFKGVKTDKQYRYLEEMLTRSLLKLDSVESGSNESVRQARRQAVRYIEAAVNLLELKAVSSESQTHISSCEQNPDQEKTGTSPHSEVSDNVVSTEPDVPAADENSCEGMSVDVEEQDVPMGDLKESGDQIVDSKEDVAPDHIDEMVVNS
ncbi:hypothetical protein BsWGS_14257 [Bradybaena similaris]